MLDEAITVMDCIPGSLDFGFCPVKERTERTFVLRNPDRRRQIKWSSSSKCPFDIKPERGVLPANGKQEITIGYTPAEANVIVASVIFQVENEGEKVLKLSAIGKFSYITLNRNSFNFGEMLIGEIGYKDLIIKNQSQVSTTFHVLKDDKHSSKFPDNAFGFDYYTGTIPPGASFLVKIRYQPSIVNMLSAQNYIVKTDSGNTQRFSCLGFALGFSVFLNTRSCNFGEVSLGKPTSRLITLNNESNAPVPFQFVSDDSGVFSFKQKEGVIMAKGSVRIIVYFNPTKPLAYYQRVFCLVMRHAVLSLDLVGTAYDLLIRPLQLTPKDIDLYRYQVFMGYTADFIKSIETERYQTQPDVHLDNPNQIALHKEMMQELAFPDRLVGVSEELIDFGFCLSGKSSDFRDFFLYNRNSFDLVIMWPTGQDVCFVVHPERIVVAAGASVVLKAYFKPNVPASYYYARIHCLAYPKLNRQGVDDIGRRSMTGPEVEGTVPPFSMNLPMVGHSFPPTTQPFIPMVNVSPKGKLIFPPCGAGDTSFQSVQLRNSNDTPVYFKTLQDPTKTFRVFPPNGIIDGKSFSIFAIEFCPKSSGNYEFELQLLLNHSTVNSIRIPLYGMCSDPSIYIDNEAMLYFPPLLTGVMSKQKIGFINNSRVPVDYYIEIPEKFRKEMEIEPFCGNLHPNERAVSEISFIPLIEANYKFNIPIRITQLADSEQEANRIGYFNPGSGQILEKPAQAQKNYFIKLIGSGGRGGIDMNPKLLDFETVSIGFNSFKTFSVRNISRYAIYIKLKILPEDEADEIAQGIIESSLKFDFTEGMLAANSSQKVNIRYTPIQRYNCNFFITCFTKQSLPNKTDYETPMSEDCRIKLKAHGDFPVITLSDMRNPKISPAQLWRQFSLAETIPAVLSPLTPVEIKFNNAEIAQTQAQNHFGKFAWDFGKIKKECQKVVLTVKNVGGVPASFKFVLPSDNELEMEPWADPGEPSPEEAFEKHILDNRIFQITPRSGTLACHEQCDIELSYHPVEVGSHHLEILFQIVHGKPILITLHGETLPEKRGYLDLAVNRYYFQPLPIGLRFAITQPIEIQNRGSGKIEYDLDLGPIEKLQEENFNFPIFEFQNKSGSLEPGEVQYLYPMFKPLESKTYEVTIAINTRDEKNYMRSTELTICGEGYHPDTNIEEIPQFKSLFPELPLCRSSFGPKVSDAGFSIEDIDFGIIKNQSPERRMVVIYNRNSSVPFNFEFKPTGLICGDNLILDPINGEVPPNGFMTIKLTLIPDYIPSIYEGELECEIDWKEYKESIFLRIRKRAEINVTAQEQDAEGVDTELIKNVLKDVVQIVLTERQTTDVLNNLTEQPSLLYTQIDNDPPAFLKQLEGTEATDTKEKRIEAKEKLFLEEEFIELAQGIMENSVYKIMNEVLGQEFNPFEAQKKYIRR